MEGPKFEIALGEERYPDPLAVLPDPPKRLYVVGNPEALREGLAVVGARRSTPYGRSAAELFAGLAAERGVGIISGGARGCDAFAHEAALACGGSTVAFLGGGCDKPYPSCNVKLFQRIVESGGAVVSEHPWGMDPRPWMFRTRNRLIAGLARATLIVEAAMPSGTFSTADEALAAGKEVLAVPGSIFSPTSEGTNVLIAQGAMPVVDRASFLELLDGLFPEYAEGQLRLFGEGEVSAVSEFADDPLLMALKADPMRLEQMVELFVQEQSVSKLMAKVSKLEALGLIERFPDGRFGAVSR